ncbi:hypothetical protein MKUB_19810 [Mycobacterium kubicae]|uniref:Transposase n=1 Tax=Mycobacterium kubicae TaxID=120959 RepID=A0ABQ1BL96_9MYCO|nr:hypothetical protein MKUB_19810 [Mycobacterium kubicae]
MAGAAGDCSPEASSRLAAGRTQIAVGERRNWAVVHRIRAVVVAGRRNREAGAAGSPKGCDFRPGDLPNDDLDTLVAGSLPRPNLLVVR